MTFTPTQLAALLDEADHHPWESVQAALARVAGQPHPRIGWLTTHLAATKREYGTLIAAATATPAPPQDAGLSRLMAWEVDAARRLTPAHLEATLTHAGQSMTVAELLRLNARHSAWHAGQIAALAGRARIA